MLYPAEFARRARAAHQARRQGRDPGRGRDEEARHERRCSPSARAACREFAAPGHELDERPQSARRPVALIGKGVTLRHRRHLDQARRRHGRHEVGHGRRGRGRRARCGCSRRARRRPTWSASARWSRTCRTATRTRPGDVVKSLSGQTVEIINTDAEGRLILCDAMWYVQEKYKPQAMVELSTLTGAIIVALGHERAGLFSNDTPLSNQLRAAGAEIGEKLWRMPLGPKYDKLIDSRDRRHEERRRRPRRRLDHGGAVPAALRAGRRRLGASRHRRHGVVEQGQRDHAQGRHRPMACACSTGWSPTTTRR